MLLHRVLAELGDEAIAHGGGLQRVDGFVQIEFAGLPQQRPGLGSRDEDLERARPGGGWITASCGRRRSWRGLAVVLVGVREVTGFLFGLLLLCPHAIELRLVEHDLDGIVPAQIVVFIEDRREPALSSFSEPRFRCP